MPIWSLAPLIEISFSTYQVVYCENCFGFCPEKKRCRFPPIRDSDFFPSEVSDLPGRKRLSHGRRFNAGGATTVLQRWKEFRGVFAGKLWTRRKNNFFLSIDGFPPPPFSWHIG